MGRFLATVILLVVIVVGVAWAFGLVNIQRTRDAHLPHMVVEGGQSPKFDANVGHVSVGTETRTVDVPKVGTVKKEVHVPTVNLEKAK